MTLTSSESTKEIVVTNDHYIAVINKENGELVSVHYKRKDGKKETQAIVSDQFNVKLADDKQTLVSTNQKSIRIDIMEVKGESIVNS